MRPLALSLVALALLASAPASPAQGLPAAHLVRDLNPAPPPYDPDAPYDGLQLGQFTSIGERAVFLVGSLGTTACSLWATDGSDAGTRPLLDLCPPVAGPGGVVQILPRLGRLAFATDTAMRLWRTDGTPDGTFALDPARVDNGRFPVATADAAGSRLLFAGCDEASGCELWASDGTRAGTRRVADLAPGPDSSHPYSFTVAGGRVIFATVGSRNTVALWTTDGTAAGTRLLRGIGGHGDLRLPIVALGDKLLFLTSSVGYQYSEDTLWALDPRTRSLRIVRENECNRTGSCSTLHPAGREVFLSRHDDQSFELFTLWRTDGTRAGTRRIELPPLDPFGAPLLFRVGDRVVFAGSADGAGLSLWTLPPGSDRAEPLADCPGGCPAGFRDPWASTVHRGLLYFAGADPGHGVELWASDGTGAGTRRVADLCPGACDGSPHAFGAAGQVLLFESQGSLWRTDGRAAGTAELARLRPLSDGSIRFALDFAAAGSTVVFEGFDDPHGIQPWASDLTPSGTRPAAALGTLGASSRISSLVALGDPALFSACGPGGAALWRSDGSAEGTEPLQGPATVPCEPFLPFGRIALAGGLAYAHWDGRLWRTDGTAAGTFPVGPSIDLETGLLRDAVELDGRLLFVLDPPYLEPPPWSWEFWTSDGTPEGTERLFRLHLGGTPYRLAVAGAEAFFLAQSPDTPFLTTLYRTDGTEAGTRPIVPGLDYLVPLEVARLGQTAYFVAALEGSSQDSELWATDGTAAGTAPIFSPALSPRPHELSGLRVWNGALYFFARVEAGGPIGLWASDGTSAGTVLLRGYPPQPPRPASFLEAVGGRLLFQVDDGVHGTELWATDGTPEGTGLVADLRPGDASSLIGWHRLVEGRLFFSANDGVHGSELWQTDGTAAGTRLVADLFPGLPSGAPEQLVAAGAGLLFTADDGLHGRELWRLPLAAGPCAPGPGALCLAGGRVRVEAYWRSAADPPWTPAAKALLLGTGGEAGAFSLLPGPGADLALRLGQGAQADAVYVAGLSAREWALVLSDLETGARRRYFNPGGRLGSLVDVEGLASAAETADRTMPASPRSPGREVARRGASSCVPGPRTLCLLERFAVQASWRTGAGGDRAAAALPLDRASGAWAVNGPGRPGLVMKVVDGRAVNGHFWLFGGSLTTLEVTLTVTDTASGSTREYVKPAGEAASLADLAAF